MKKFATLSGSTTMNQFFAQVKVICGRFLEGFRQSRLRAELPDADKLLGRRFDHPIDDPRASGPPMVGIL